MIRRVRLMAVVVVVLLIGCTALVIVGCAGVRSEAPQEEQRHNEATTQEQGHSFEATASEEARCGKTRTLHRTSYLGPLVTNDVPGCPKGGPLTGTDKSDNLDGMEGDDEIRGLGGDDFISGGTGNDTVYGGPGDDIIHTGGDGEREELYCGEGKDNFLADKLDYVSSSCEVNGIPSNQ